MHTAHEQVPIIDRASASGLRVMFLLRACVLGIGVSAAVIVELTDGPSRLDALMVCAAAVLYLSSTLSTFSPFFPRSSHTATVVLALLDIVTLLLLFRLPGGTEFVESFIAVPALWLGIILGRRGIAVAGLSCTLLFVIPGLALHGVDGLGWHQGISIVVFALIASTSLVASAEMWADYNTRLETTAEELRCALKVKDDFISLVSHELRTPLTSIIGYLDLATDEVQGLPGPVGSYLNAVSRNADRLLVLVTDLLAAERAEREPMHLAARPTDLSSLAQLGLADLALRAECADVSITAEIEPGITISADPTRILQVIDNLLSNAVKYTPPTGNITLVLRREPSDVLLEVRDTGIGIHVEDMGSLFTKFFRARNATAMAIPGIGLGLMISRIIVEAHGGTIEAHSQEGIGTSFLVRLPREPTRSPIAGGDPVLAAETRASLMSGPSQALPAR